MEIFLSAINVLQTYETTSYVSSKGSESRRRSKRKKYFIECKSMMPLSDDEDEKLQEVVEVLRREAKFQKRAGERYEHGGGSGGRGRWRGSTGIL
jgi:hypothetical protein